MLQPQSKELPRAISPEQMAELLGVCRATAYAMLKNGIVPCVRAGRRRLIPVQALEQYLAGFSTQGAVV
jgi:excisionase family DNA binding protein